MLENATNAVGGSSSGHRALEYPLWRVMTEGGPSHTSGHVETYAKRLRETGRTTHADTVESREGVVSRSVASALADED